MTTIRPQSRQQPKATNDSSMQRETPAPTGVLQPSPKPLAKEEKEQIRIVKLSLREVRVRCQNR